MALTPEQEHYIAAILKKSELDLLYEVVSGELQGVTASAQQISESERLARFQRLLHRVPTGPVPEYSKPMLEIHLAGARNTVQRIKQRLYQTLCNPSTQQPTALALDIAAGNVKDIIASIAGLLLTQHSTALAVGIPATALLLREGLRSFCASKPTTI